MNDNSYDKIREVIMQRNGFKKSDTTLNLGLNNPFKPDKIRKDINEKVNIEIENFRDDENITKKQIMLGCISKEFQNVLTFEDNSQNDIAALKEKCTAKQTKFVKKLFIKPDGTGRSFKSKTKDMLALYCGYLGWNDLDINDTFTYKELKGRKLLDEQIMEVENVKSAIIIHQNNIKDELKDGQNEIISAIDKVIAHQQNETQGILFHTKSYLEDDTLVFGLLNQVLTLQETLLMKHSFLQNLKSNSYIDVVEKEINNIKHQQHICLEELENFLLHKPEIFLTPDFIECFNAVYYYEWEDTNSLIIAKKLNTICNVILEYIDSDDSDISLSLRVNSLKVNWAIGEIIPAEKRFNRAYSQVKLLDATDALSKEKLQDYQADLLDYGCGFNTNFLIEYRDFASNYIGEKSDATNMQITSLQCTACRLINEKQLDEAKKWLDETEHQVDKYFNDEKIAYKKKHYRLSYFNFIKGAYCFKKEKFTEAEKYLQSSLENFDKAEIKSDLVERAFIFYMLFKIYKFNNNEKSSLYGLLALNIMRNSIRRNYCLFDFKKVLEELERESVRLY